jgi:hypothetical protein
MDDDWQGAAQWLCKRCLRGHFWGKGLRNPEVSACKTNARSRGWRLWRGVSCYPLEVFSLFSGTGFQACRCARRSPKICEPGGIARVPGPVGWRMPPVYRPGSDPYGANIRSFGRGIRLLAPNVPIFGLTCRSFGATIGLYEVERRSNGTIIPASDATRAAFGVSFPVNGAPTATAIAVCFQKCPS